MERRKFLISSGFAITSALAAPLNSAGRPIPLGGKGLIDAHCHIFNGSDLPSVRFIKIVLIKNYPKQATRVLDIDKPDAVDQLIRLLLWIMGQTRAPLAQREIEVLDGVNLALSINQSKAENKRAVIRALAEAIAPSKVKVADGDAPPKIPDVLTALYKAAGPLAVADNATQQERAVAAANRAFASRTDLGIVLRWFALFTRYRFALADELAITYAEQGFEPELLCPAMVDYDSWLGQAVDKSPLPMQVAVMGRIARRKRGAPVHGYVSFDPLRQARFEAGRFDQFDPLELVRTAIQKEGFIGVKLYPPMGFRAWGNETAICQPYPREVVDDLVSTAAKTSDARCPRLTEVGRRLDHALDSLYRYCSEEGIAVLSHANDSNGAGKEYSQRADPSYWLKVFERHPQLHVSLAHFGTFSATAVDSAPGATSPESSWEWAFGRHVATKPEAPVFMDISYLAEILGQKAKFLDDYQQNVKHWIEHFDPECKHLIFGTDWIMLGVQSEYGTYTTQVHSFFKDRVGLSEVQLNQLFSKNAVRFLGLHRGGKNWDRLRAFYLRHDVPLSKFPRLL